MYTKQDGKKMSEGIHAHLAYFGSELACKECNPNCYKNHGMGRAKWCGDKNCPAKPKTMKNERLVELLAFAKVCFDNCTNPFAHKYLVLKDVSSDECGELSAMIAEAIENRLWFFDPWSDKALEEAKKEFEEAEKNAC